MSPLMRSRSASDCLIWASHVAIWASALSCSASALRTAVLYSRLSIV